MLITEAPVDGLADRLAGGGAGDPALGARDGGERDVECPRARPHAEDADAVLRRGGHGRGRGAVRVRHRHAGERGEVRAPVHSGCVTSAAASTSAISGLSGVTGGGVSSGAATSARQAFGGAGERVVRDRLTRRAACWPARRPAARRLRSASANARACARDHVAAEPEWLGAEALGDRRRPPARDARRRARCQDQHAPRRPSRRPEAPSATSLRLRGGRAQQQGGEGCDERLGSRGRQHGEADRSGAS